MQTFNMWSASCHAPSLPSSPPGIDLLSHSTQATLSNAIFHPIAACVKKHPVRTCNCKSNKTADDEQSLTLASFVATRGGTMHEARGTNALSSRQRQRQPGVNGSRLVLRSRARPRPAIARRIASRVAMQKASVFGLAE